MIQGKEQINLSDEDFSKEETGIDEIDYSEEDIKFYKWLGILILMIWVLSLLVSYISESQMGV